MKRSLILCLVLLFVTGAGKVAQADSLYKDVPEGISIFSDIQPKRIGDLITILISESASATQKAETKTEKDASTNGSAGTGMLDFITGWGMTNKEKYEGTGSVLRSGKLSAKITVRVVDILPDGNLKVEGTQILKINREKQTITLTGIIRPQDILANNTVYSYYVADAQIRYDGKGPLARKQKPGLLGRIFDWIF